MELGKGNFSGNRSESQPEGFAEEMELLEELMMAADHKVRELRGTQEAGTEELRKAQKEAYMLTRIAKIILKEQNAVSNDDQKSSAIVARRLLDGSASAYLYKNAESIEVRVVDNIDQCKVLAVLKVEIGLVNCVLINEFQFY